ncbi:5-carboxymethyl-2-hydroxymuconate Delta-isomerase [Kribbella sp. NPDC056345]|uniref:5-carboxymethyl-2-hydroxymuconate Delta-isomerase n=1 Tax=Kribbella sp. NPDC056345 TaxID=3345789 RepID=UPI0035D82287
MPQITVEYSDSLVDAFDRRGFALALHPAAADLIGSSVPGFKTRFVRLDDAVIGTGDPAEAMIHITIAVLPGRDAALKDRLGDLTLTTLTDHLKPTPDLNTQLTVEIRDLATYHKRPD